MLESLLSGIRYGLRTLVANPGFTIIVVTTLAVGIGANTAIFGLLDAVLLRTLPVERPEELFFVNFAGSESRGSAPPYPCFEQLRDHTTHLSGIAAFSMSSFKVVIDGQIEEVSGQFASGNYFSLLGVGTAIGSSFGPLDDWIPGQGGPNGPVAVLGYSYWQRRFGLDPTVIGRVIEVGLQCSQCGQGFQRTPVTVIGVTKPGFAGLAPGHELDIHLPIALQGTERLSDRNGFWLSAVARLRPGSSPEQARAELDPVFKAFVDELGFPSEIRHKFLDQIELTAANRGFGTLRGPFAKPLVALMAMVGLVLLIACANVANLLLARAAASEKDLAVRCALGASRSHILGQTLIEGLLLAGLGGLAGLLLARWSSALLVNLLSTERDPVILNLSLNGSLLVFTFGVSLLSVILFSLAPALRSIHLDPGSVLKETASSHTGGRPRFRFRKVLIFGQIALSFLVLTCAGLFLRSLHILKNVDAGFQPERVLTMRLDIEARAYVGTQLNTFWEDVLGRVKSVAGVSSASLSAVTPLDGRMQGTMIDIPGFTAETPLDNSVDVNHVSAEYFETLGIAVKRGRPFHESDRQSAVKVALLNESAARFFFGERDPVGAKIRILHPPIEEPYEIVGVVADSRRKSLREESGRLLYLPNLQAIASLSDLTLAVRSALDPLALAGPIKAELRSMDPDLLITQIVTLESQRDQSLVRERLVFWLSTVFAGLAMLLTCVGIYGAIACDVALRKQEISLRIALGSPKGQVLRLMLERGMVLVGAGLLLGCIASFATTRLLASLLYGVSATDPGTFAVVALLLAAVGLGAVYLPVRRGITVEPMAILRG